MVPNTLVGVSSIVQVFASNKTAPHRLSEFYQGLGYVAAGDTQPYGIPTAGEISLGDFRGAAKVGGVAMPPVTTNLTTYLTGDSFDVATNTWTNLSGTGTHVQTANIVGTVTKTSNALNGKAIISGTPSTSIRILAALPTNYTLFHLTRYNGTNRTRIFSTTAEGSIAWLSGFWNTNTGVVFHGGWMNLTDIGFGNNFFLSTDQPALYRANRGNQFTSGSGTFSRDNFGINQNAEKSDWACALVLVYDRILTSTEYINVENWVLQQYNV